MRRIKRWISEHPYMVLLIAQLIVMIYFGVIYSLQVMRLRRLTRMLEILLLPEMQMWHY